MQGVVLFASGHNYLEMGARVSGGDLDLAKGFGIVKVQKTL